MIRKSKNLMNDGVKKQIVQDVVLPRQKKPISTSAPGPENNRRSIRDIPIPTGASARRSPTEEKASNATNDDGALDSHIPKSPKMNMQKTVLWGIVFVSVITLVFAISSLFNGATVTITPKQQQVTLNHTLSASKEKNSSDLTYQIIEISDTASKVVSSDDEEFVEERSSGNIVIYNDHSSASQELVARTRFETPDGKIYRIQEGVTVPGQKIVDGKEVPGQIEVTVYADEVGPEYNVGLTEFTIPGFKGESRFENFSAKSKTPMTGGFNGTRPVVNEDTASQAKIELEELLKERLTNELNGRISGNIIIPENSIFFTSELLPSSKVDADKVEIISRGTLSAVSISTAELAEAILEKTGDRPATPVKIDNINDIQVNFSNVENFDIQQTKDISLGVTGVANIVWIIDEEQIKNDLSGQNKKNVQEILSKYEAVDKGRAVVRPFWKRTFPSNVSKIKVKTELE